MSTGTPGAPAVPEAEILPVPEVAAPPCQNCGVALLGPHCHACGQPVKGLVRHFSSVIGDFFDSVFDFDSRTLRTLWPLFARPGYLTCEYFEGRRVRYVSPVRLFFFLAIVAFFVGSLTLHVEGTGVQIDAGTPVRAPSAAALAEAASADPAAAGPDATEPGATGAAASEPAAPPGERDSYFSFGDGDWDPETNPVEIGLLPDFGNAWLNRQVGRAERNIERLKDEPDLYVRALLGSIPTALFVLMPLFALLLKLAYVFKRRLYMEHLIVALHSHAFLCLSLLLLFLLSAARDAFPALLVPARIAVVALAVWMPLYLLLMQKRVYRQGWPMTLLKYVVLGVCYTVLLSLGLLAISLGSLVWM